MLKSQTSRSLELQVLPGCSMHNKEEILLPQQKLQNINQSSTIQIHYQILLLFPGKS